MTPAHMRSFHAVATTGSFTAAARQLHISQPPVTKHIRDLETLYGVELFHRHSRGAELTDIGRTLLLIVQRAVVNQMEAVDYLREAGNLRTGHIRIGAVNPSQAAEALARFAARYPAVQATVAAGNSHALVHDLRGYRADIAVIGRVPAMDDLEAIEFGRPEIVAVVNHRHPWARRRSVRLADLGSQPLIMREAGSETRRILEAAARRSGVALKARAEFAGREGLLAAVAHGIGIGAASEDQILDSPRLHKVRISDVDMRTQVLVCCLKERREARVIKAFMDCARAAAAAPGRGASNGGA